MRACVLEFQDSWDNYISPMDFSYNNHHHSSIRMTPYEALYDKKCRSVIFWNEECLRILEEPELVQEIVDKINIMKSRLGAAQDR